MKKLTLKVLILLCCFNFSSIAQVVSEQDRLALVALYNSTNGSIWTNNTGWLEEGVPVSDWFGVTVENERVTRLELWNNNLSGSLPAEIGELAGLRELYLGGNQIGGEIPMEIGSLSSLHTLYLYGNQLTGSLPISVGDLVNLYNLSLGGNQLSGLIPTEVGKLTNLHWLNLGNNQFSGEIPSSLSNLPNLQSLHINHNSFSGVIPVELCNITMLNEVNFQFNNFDEQSCPVIKCLKNNGVNFVWDYRQLQKNGFSLTNGCMPNPVLSQDSLALVAFFIATEGYNWNNNTNWLTSEPVSTWYGVTVENGRVRGIELWSNNLTGILPPEIGQLTGLNYLYLGNNRIKGNIPAELGLLSNIERILLYRNQLDGFIPPEIGNLELLGSLNLNWNNLSGSIPSEIGQLINLYDLSLQNNQITGSVPSEVKNCINLQYLYLNDNKLEGHLPIDLCNLSLRNANFSNNYFDLTSCGTFQCLADKGVQLEGNIKQQQKNGTLFPDYCNPDVNRSLIFTEARLGSMYEAYVEITNVGNTPVQLNEYEFGTIRPWSQPWNPEANRFFMLPEHILNPGESFVIAAVTDFGPRQWRIDPDHYLERQTKKEWYEIADIKFHIKEVNGDETDKIIGDFWWTFDVWHGRECWYLKQHLSETEKVVVDQVGGVFDENGSNREEGIYDVAGFPKATKTATLIRKANVLVGNLDFANGRGTGKDDSEWIAIPHLNGDSEPWRAVFWTAGNHGDYSLNETSLVSSTLSVDWINKTIAAPWGTRGLDDFMFQFEKRPGLAWHYHLSDNNEDLRYMSARTGDRITIYACGDDMQEETFDIIVLPSEEDDNIVIPKYRLSSGAKFFYGFGPNVKAGQVDWPRVTLNNHEMDTITGSHFGLPYATRTDSLIKYLEFPANATYQFIFNGGYERADLKTGDILKVTAKNGAVKEYFIQVQPYRPNHDAQLAGIVWPGIPEGLKGKEGWNGNTIPGFYPDIYEYTLNIPSEFEGFPILLAIASDPSAKITTTFNNPVQGNIENKIFVYTVTAEDGYTTRQYKVHLNKLKDPANAQPYRARPFLSEFIYWDQWSNSFGEICNPGTEPLDLSNYMIAMDWINNPAEMIAETNEGNWLDRFDKYIPGFKWKSEGEWTGSEYIAVPDPEVNPVIQPGDVFCFGTIYTDTHSAPAWLPDYVWPVPAELDVQFNNYYGNKTYLNPWGELVSGNGNPIRKWSNANWYLFEIKNEAVKLGLKPATDPNDFELIESWGMGEDTEWIIGGNQAQLVTNWMRKPEIHKPNPLWGTQGSFGTNSEDCEWTWTNRAYWQSMHAGWPLDILNIGNNLGKHILHEVTGYQSVIYSNYYKVSTGYSMDETIRGVVTGTSVTEFLSYIIKANEGQQLKIFGLENDSFSGGEILEVASADGSNLTRYNIEVSSVGLSNDAMLTSEVWEISFPTDVAEIAGFEFGTPLQTVVDNIVVPYGASMVIYDENHNLVPFQMFNKQGQTVDVTVNAKTYFEVTAEDDQTIIVYRLVPAFPQDEIVATSDYFYVNNEESVIGSILPSTTVGELLANLYLEDGATAIVIDKFGYQRTEGTLYPDDRVVIIYNWDAYYELKVANIDPRTYKVYTIYMCESLPIATARDIILELDATGLATISAEDMDNGSYNMCGESWLSLSKYEFTCNEIGENEVVLTIQTDMGGIASTKATVTVIDNIPPEVLVEDCVFNFEDGKVKEIIRDYLQISDKCGIRSIENNAPDVFPIGTTEVLWKILDMGGNEVTANQLVTILYDAPIKIIIIAPSEPVEMSNEIRVVAQVEANVIIEAVWDWGDGSTSNAVITDEIYGSHYYSVPGVYVLSLKVTDKNDRVEIMQYRYVVIYEFAGDFVTGGGWINSPVGASVHYSDSKGMANFGFVSKYQKGKFGPVGNSEVKFKAGNLEFHSSENNMYVIAGSKAIISGKGTINGEKNYNFLLSALDGDLKTKKVPDMFRIKIWDLNTNEMIYDSQPDSFEDENPTTEISGGSIIIFNPKKKSAESGQNPTDFFENLKVYPNPVDDKLIVSGISPLQYSDIRLIDITGKVIWMKTQHSGSIEIDMSDFAPGLYSLFLISNNEVKMIKVVKK